MPSSRAGGRTRGVILDVDGTLVDSNDAHAHAWIDAFAEAGLPAEFGRVRRLIGMGGDKLVPAVLGVSEDSAVGRRLGARRGEIFRTTYLPRVRPFPGARELVEAIEARRLAVVVASSAAEADLRALLDVAGVARLIDGKTSKDDADRSKPDPDVVRAALGRLALMPEAAIMIGDTPYDVEAAGRAGVATIALRCGGWDDEALRGAAAIYDDAADLLAHLDGSPLAR